MPTDEEQIRTLAATWMAATRIGDIDTVPGLIAEDAVFLVPGNAPMRKSEFASVARVQTERAAPKVDGSSDIQEIKVVGDWAFMWAKPKVVATPPDGSPPKVHAGHTLTVLDKQNGRWLLARDANIPAPLPERE